ncbi:isochorismatase family protein [Streptomyces sp. NPDC029041]|uniref:cysteine hydrolase family protein n=1 Tax=Streptomyces sp. NPDC029041 TaxID=3155727 RepID=UPI0033FFBE20
MPTPSQATPLDELLRDHGVRRVVVTGSATEYCVDSTSRSALSCSCDLVLVADVRARAR